MSRAPGPIGVAFGLALALVILLVGPLLLFNPPFVSALQARHEVAASFGTSREDVDRVTAEMIGDLFSGGMFEAAFDGEPPLLNERERSHMGDVSRLVQLLTAVALLASALALVTGYLLRREPMRQGRIMVTAAGAIGAVAVILAVAFAVAFDATFLAFHEIFFPPGTYLFEPGSRLITLFPGGFWFDASLAAGGAVILTALVVALIGIARWRARSRTPTGP
jgi:integral membrane protein (TIGR01906 family)